MRGKKIPLNEAIKDLLWSLLEHDQDSTRSRQLAGYCAAACPHFRECGYCADFRVDAATKRAIRRFERRRRTTERGQRCC